MNVSVHISICDSVYDKTFQDQETELTDADVSGPGTLQYLSV